MHAHVDPFLKDRRTTFEFGTPMTMPSCPRGREYGVVVLRDIICGISNNIVSESPYIFLSLHLFHFLISVPYNLLLTPYVLFITHGMPLRFPTHNLQND